MRFRSVPTVGEVYIPNERRGQGPDGLRQQFTQKERDIETGLDYFSLDITRQRRVALPRRTNSRVAPDELYTFADDASANPTFYADLKSAVPKQVSVQLHNCLAFCDFLIRHYQKC